MKTKLTLLITIIGICILGCTSEKQEGATASKSSFDEILSKYNTDIPEGILTPDKVETRIGSLEFFDGLPTEETAQKLYDNLDFLRGVETFLNGIPATSIEGLRIGMLEIGAKNSNEVVIFDDVMDSNPLFLTGNTSTVYASAFLDLEKDGPTVVEVPAGSGPGTVNDAFFRFVIDMGPPGPDKGNGGKYLILPHDYEGDTPEGYFSVKSTSHINWVILRGFLVDAKPNAASRMYRDGLKIYPLKDAQNPPEMVFINGSGKSFNTIHANNYEFYQELSDVIQREPVSFLDPELRGLFSSIGIQKGKEFNPDDRLKAILEDAVKVGNATARAISFRTREKEALIYEDRRWESGFVGGDYRWLKDGGNGGRFLDARTRFFYVATVNTPAMVWKLIGKGSKYAMGTLDNKGNYLDGSKNYKLNIPANPPVKAFWSVVVYDPQTRSELQTSQHLPSVNSQRSPLVKNADGSIDLYFGPEAPEGKENNWIQTVPGKGWFSLLRLYSPLEPWYDQTWKPGDIELVE
jgi:hypothetical protein